MQTTTQTNVWVRSQHCITSTSITALSLLLSLFHHPPFLPSSFQVHFNFSCSWKSHASKIAPTIKYVGSIMACTVASEESQRSIIATQIKKTIFFFLKKKEKRLEACQLWIGKAKRLKCLQRTKGWDREGDCVRNPFFYYYYFTLSCHTVLWIDTSSRPLLWLRTQLLSRKKKSMTRTFNKWNDYITAQLPWRQCLPWTGKKKKNGWVFPSFLISPWLAYCTFRIKAKMACVC